VFFLWRILWFATALIYFSIAYVQGKLIWSYANYDERHGTCEYIMDAQRAYIPIKPSIWADGYHSFMPVDPTVNRHNETTETSGLYVECYKTHNADMVKFYHARTELEQVCESFIPTRGGTGPDYEFSRSEHSKVFFGKFLKKNVMTEGDATIYAAREQCFNDLHNLDWQRSKDDTRAMEVLKENLYGGKIAAATKKWQGEYNKLNGNKQ
jgi:hypothetical protein